LFHIWDIKRAENFYGTTDFGRSEIRVERQAWLWDGVEQVGLLEQWKGLRDTFKSRSAQIGLILTYSPAEYEKALGLSA
jgi:hypothetical protein